MYHGSMSLMLLLLFSTPFLMHVVIGGEGYWVAATGAAAFTALCLQSGKKGLALRLSSVDVVLAVCLGYMLLNLHRPVNVVLCIELLTLTGIWAALRQQEARRFRWWAAVGMALSASLQALVALLQYAGVLGSRHPEFLVTGTFGNPGPLGGYLAMGFAISWPLLFGRTGRSGWQKGGLLLGGTLLTAALVVAGSRAAWLAVGLAICVFHLRSLTGKKRSAWLLLSGLGILAVGAALMLYTYRPASADARLRIWSVCGTMVAEAPWTGQGTGGFAATYMPAQTATLSGASTEERRMADDVTVAFNETLGTLCEQGLVGLLLAACFIASAGRNLWRNFRRDGRNVFFFPFIALLVFAQFSYPLSVWSLCAPFFALSAVGQDRGRQQISLRYGRPIVIGLSAAACLVFVLATVSRLDAYRRLEGYCRLEEPPVSVADCSGTVWWLRHDPALLAAHAEAQVMVGDEETAITTIGRLLEYTDKTHWHISLGDAYAEAGKKESADRCYATAHAMRPGLMEPLFARLQLWREEDPERALSQAVALIKAQPKKENKRTRAMKAEASRFIDRYRYRPLTKD